MENNSKNLSREIETSSIDLRKFIPSLLNKAWQICLVTFLCGIIAFVGSVMLLTPEYQASALFYVNNSSVSFGDASLSITSGDLTTSKTLVNSYIVILRSRATLMDVIDYADSKRSYESLRSMISADAVNGTEVFRVTVTSTDPKEAETLANAIAHVIPNRIATIIEGSSAKVVDYAVLPKGPSYPNNMKNMLLGLFVGFTLSVAFVVFVEIFDVTINDEEDLMNCCSYPILATVPNMNKTAKRGYGRSYYYGSYRKHKEKDKDSASSESVADRNKSIIGSEISFAAAEAYKLLRTKLQYSFADEQTCRVFAVSSASSGEGKSVTSVNLAYSLAQLDKRVLLIDCDMRRPTLAEKLSLSKYPGLSEYLTGIIGLDKVLQTSKVNGKDVFTVVTAGTRPPNPVELINSARMLSLLRQLRERFDYIILDMPPIGDVSDALISAKLTDGVLLVVRQDYGSRVAVCEALQQFEFVNAKILGVLFNCVSDRATRYTNKKYGYGYRKKYYYSSKYVENDKK